MLETTLFRNNSHILPDELASVNSNQLSSSDAVLVAAQWHRVLFENDFFRVLEVIVKPGEVVPFHTHQWDSIIVTLQDTRFIAKNSQGLISLEEGLENDRLPQADFLKGSLETYSYRNIGSKKFQAIVFELKNK